MKNNIKYYSLLFILLAIKLSAQEDNKPTNFGALITDRPDATEASSTVGKGVLQIETGGLYESFEDNNVTVETTTFNTTLIRYGLLSNMEIRLGWDFVEGVTKVNGNKLFTIDDVKNPKKS